MKLYYMSTNGWNAIMGIERGRACYYVDSYEDENIEDDNGTPETIEDDSIISARYSGWSIEDMR